MSSCPCIVFSVWLLILIINITKAQNVFVSHKISTDPDLGPVIQISCTLSELPANSTDLTVQWYLYSVLLSENNMLTGADSSRYTVSEDGLTLSLQNSLKEDEGTYTCRVWYRLSLASSAQFLERSDDVQIASYLPSLNYPVCSLSPDDTFVDGDVVQFQCIQGISRPQATMQIIVQRTDGTSSILHTSTGTRVSVSRETTAEYQDALFLCNVTSDTFPSFNVQQSCTAKLITPTSTSISPSTENLSTQGTSQSHSSTDLITTDIFSSSELMTTWSSQKPSSSEPRTPGTSQEPVAVSSEPTMPLMPTKPVTTKRLTTIKSETKQTQYTHKPSVSVISNYASLTQCKYNLTSFVVPLIIAIIAIVIAILLSLKIIQLNKVIDGWYEDQDIKDHDGATNHGIEQEDMASPYAPHRMTQI